jgi:CubicO group peptidase (beta-lactamase class C family)
LTAADASRGTVAPGFEPVRAALDDLLEADSSYSAQLAAYWRGEQIINLVGGPNLAEDSITGVFSASKGVAAFVIAMLVDRDLLYLDAPVATYWPEFAALGKRLITVRELLSHQAGLSGVDGGLGIEEILQSGLGAARLADTRPQWMPGSAFGYHGITIGILMEELVRRVSGETLQEFYEREIRAPRNIDFYLGLPEKQESRYQAILPLIPTPDQAAEIGQRPNNSSSLMGVAFSLHETVDGVTTPLDPIWPNDRRIRAAGSAAIGGVGSARGLAQVYSAAITPVDGSALMTPKTLALMTQQQTWGTDRVLGFQMCFAVVFMKPHPANDFGSYAAFGHDGAGGVLAFADPNYDLSFAYIPNPMAYPGGTDPKALRLAEAVRASLPAGGGY